MKLQDSRKKIDYIDKKILELLNLRAAEAVKISSLKKKNNLSVFSPEREACLLNRLKKINKGILGLEDVENIFREILSVCRSKQAALRVAYLGPCGTFTQMAAVKKFGKKAGLIPADSISDVFDRVQRGEADYGVVPVENSTEGVVNYTLDMFFNSSLSICAEIVLMVSHHLLAKPSCGISKIKKVYSHYQVFPQCRNWISVNLKNCELIPVSSTAQAAAKAVGEKDAACIGSKILADIYGLSSIASSIEDSSSNFTRFLVISAHDSAPSGKDKTSVLFAVKDRVGALYDALFAFKKYRINLTKIESRPSKKKPWEYYFFVDFQRHRNFPAVKGALKMLEESCIFVKVLGSYPQDI